MATHCHGRRATVGLVRIMASQGRRGRGRHMHPRPLVQTGTLAPCEPGQRQFPR
jgi:hypothetical protein